MSIIGKVVWAVNVLLLIWNNSIRTVPYEVLNAMMLVVATFMFLSYFMKGGDLK